MLFRSDNVSEDALLRDPGELVFRNGEYPPEEIAYATSNPNGNGEFSPSQGDTKAILSREMPPGDSYVNAPLVNFVHTENQQRMQTALREVRQRLGKKYPLTIGGEKIWTERTIASINPSKPEEAVGFQSEAGLAEADRAVEAAKKAFDRWSRTPVGDRAAILERCAAIMDRRRFELCALEVFEVGKAWAVCFGPGFEIGRAHV